MHFQGLKALVSRYLVIHWDQLEGRIPVLAIHYT